MDPKIVESELRNHKIREGPIYKRTKFLQEWRQRWMVLTMNYVLIFTNRNLKELAEFIDLREVKTYKSYLKKEEDMIPAGFKIRTLEDMFYFCARNCNEKWTWLVSIERLMDFKYAGKSPYNNAEWIRTKGFMGQRQFERGKFDEPEFDQPKEPEKPQSPQKTKEQSKPESPKVDDQDYKNKLKQLDDEMQRLKEKEEEMLRKERQQEELFLFELNKLKKTEQSLRQLQLQVQEKAREAEKILEGGHSREVFRQVYVERPAQPIPDKPISAAIETPTNSAQKPVQKAPQSPEKTEIKKTQEQDILGDPADDPPETLVTQTTELKVDQKPAVAMTTSAIMQKQPEAVPAAKLEKKPSGHESPLPVKSSGMSKRIEDMKNFFESKRMGNSISTPVSISTKQSEKKVEKKDQTVSLHMFRDRIVVNLLEEFHPKAYNYAGLRYIIQFLVRICADRGLGYQSYLIRQAKSNQNRFLFAQVLLELINDFKKYQEFGTLAKIIQVLIFEAPGIFKLNHFDLVKRKLVDLVYHAPEQHADLPILLKTLYVVHKMKNLQKNQELKEKLTTLSEKMLSVEGKNWAKKLVEDL